MIDPPGLGKSDASTAGYDTATVSRLLEESLLPVLRGSYHLVGRDGGAWIAYAWAAQLPSCVKSLTLV